jgi:penicillin V acylase-like amidase (Ntn superfamily)
MHTSIRHMMIVLGCATILCCAASSATACSSVFFTGTLGEAPAVIARTMDFEENEGKAIGVGLSGDENVSDVNMQDNVTERAAWTNRYDYVGKLLNAAPMFVEGINTAGVSVGSFYMPGITRFAEYDPQGKPALSFVSYIPYLLGMSATVEEALVNMGKVQVVMGALQTGPGAYMAPTLHYVIRDKHGKCAVVEFVEGGVRIYLDKNLTYNINIQELEAATGGTVNQRYAGAGKVITNNPTYDWQNGCFQKQDNYFKWTGDRTDRTWDGTTQNGSGTYGLRGDWTATSRFQRLMAILKSGISPIPSTTAQAKYLAYGAINSVIQPAGVSVCPTIWMSISDLKNGDYLYRLLVLFNQTSTDTNTVLEIPNDPGDFRMETFNVNKVRDYLSEKRGNVLQIIIEAGKTLTEVEKSAVMNAFLAPSGGAAPLVTTFYND